MATRSSTRSRAVASASSTPAPPLPRPPPIAQPTSATSPQLKELRCQWKWAAVSQFLYTFAQLVNLEDVTLVDVENDLVHSTMVVIPRLMHRLLVTLTQDRRTTVDNWQTALRRQYSRRDPAANPIGVEPVLSRNSRAATVDSEVKSEQQDFGLGDDANNAELEERQLSGGARSPDAADNGDAGEDHENRATKVKEYGSLIVNKEILTSDKDDGLDNNGADPMRNWADLTMLEKLESLHTVIEWHFHNPTRLRHAMRSDDENALWRIEPIGYDAKYNAYWLIGSDRLWIQRVVPKPQKKSGKRKATSSADNRKTKAPRNEVKGTGSISWNVSPRAESRPNFKTRKSDRGPSTSRRGSRPTEVTDAEILSSPTNGRSRAAKTQANVKLDLQAKQLAAAKAEIESFNRRSTARSSPSKSSSRPILGTRASRRLRGDDDDDEWQQIPEEWMPPSEDEKSKSLGTQRNSAPIRTSARNKAPPRLQKQAALKSDSEDVAWDSDNESELTELSDLSDNSEVIEPVHLPATSAEDTSEPKADLEEAHPLPQETPLPSGFVEWETLCVSLEEWESVASRFEKATHYLEKALHKFLVQEIVPYVTETLREVERQRMREESLMTRKRSSRIAIKETEKESARVAAEQQAGEEEKMARMRRLEARTRKEEEDRMQRELAREQRRKEREERELARTRRMESKSDEEDIEPIKIKIQPSEPKTPNKPQLISAPTSTKPPRHRTTKKASRKNASNDEWELDCEVCGSKGINKDDGAPLMSCGKCNKWQHITCHDSIDRKAGRKLRDWEAVDFLCKRCISSQNGLAYRKRPAQTVHTKIGSNINGYHPSNSVITPAPRHGTMGYPNGSASSSLHDGVVLPYHQPSPGTSGFVGFAHYQPEQRGFSPHPLNFQGQHQLQPRGTTHPSLPSRLPAELSQQATWDPRAQTHGIAQTNGQSSFPASTFAPLPDMQYGIRSGPPSNYQPYSTVLNGPVPRQPTHGGQYSPYSFHPQQGSYNSSYYSQT